MSADLTKKCNVFIYIHPLTHLLGIAGPSQVFWEANALIPEAYKLHFVSFLPKIKSAQGLVLTEIVHLEQIEPQVNDIFLIPGVDLDKYLRNELTKEESEAHEWIKKQNEKGVRFFSIGSGTLILANAGILDNIQCTSHWKCSDHFKNNFPKIKFIESKIFIKDQNIISSAGMTASIDSSLAIVEEDHGPVFASRLALELLVFIRRFGHESQVSHYLDYKSHFNPLVHHVQNIISSNMSKNHTNAELAEIANTSERNLTRVFKQTLGLTITEYKNTLRMELAAHLLNNKSLSINQIAIECGYNDPRQLKRILKKNS